MIFQLQWNIGNISDIFLQYSVLCGLCLYSVLSHALLFQPRVTNNLNIVLCVDRQNVSHVRVRRTSAYPAPSRLYCTKCNKALAVPVIHFIRSRHSQQTFGTILHFLPDLRAYSLSSTNDSWIYYMIL